MTIYNSINNGTQIETSNCVLGLHAGNITHDPSAVENLLLGVNAGNAITTATRNVLAGFECGSFMQTSIGNVGIGANCLAFSLVGNYNVGIGFASLNICTASQNTAIGAQSLILLRGGSYNIGIGFAAGNNYTGTESHNILIGDFGVVGESNTMRLGDYGTGTGQQNKTFIAACYSNYGTNNTFVGEQAGNITLSVPGAIKNTFTGRNAGISIVDGPDNCVYGALAGILLDSGNDNCIFGADAGASITSSAENCIFGSEAGNLLDANGNTLIGTFAGNNLVSGVQNICLGLNSGGNYTSSETNNICIGNSGTIGESNAIRIGDVSTHTSCFVQGISGVTVATSTAVVINSAGQMGTIISSRRYKKNIEDMPDTHVMKLRPVTFNYKEFPENLEYGLIAEEVEEVFPELVYYKNDKIESVRYERLPVLLLKELQKQSERIRKLETMLNEG